MRRSSIDSQNGSSSGGMVETSMSPSSIVWYKSCGELCPLIGNVLGSIKGEY